MQTVVSTFMSLVMMYCRWSCDQLAILHFFQNLMILYKISLHLPQTVVLWKWIIGCCGNGHHSIQSFNFLVCPYGNIICSH